MELPNAQYADSQAYRFGFNGKENDREWGTANLTQDYGFRLYNPAIAKFLSVDPLSPEYPWYTPYQFAGNMPICAIDLDGAEPRLKITSEVTGYTILRIPGKASKAIYDIVPTYKAVLYSDRGKMLASYNFTRDSWYSKSAVKNDNGGIQYLLFNRTFEPKKEGVIYGTIPQKYVGHDAFALTENGKIKLQAEPFTQEDNIFSDGTIIDDGREELDVAKGVMLHIAGYYNNNETKKTSFAASYGCFGFVPTSQIFKSKKTAQKFLSKNLDKPSFNTTTNRQYGKFISKVVAEYTQDKKYLEVEIIKRKENEYDKKAEICRPD